MKNSKILIVDDEEDVILALRFRLETAGYAVLTASNGKQALAHLERNNIDVVLADFMMPEVNGLELAEAVQQRREWSSTKVLLFSCHTDPQIRARARELGAVDYLSKMNGAGAIVRRVYDVLNEADAGAPAPAPAAHPPAESSVSSRLCALSADISGGSQQETRAEDLAAAAADAVSAPESLADDLGRLSVSVQARSLARPRF